MKSCTAALYIYVFFINSQFTNQSLFYGFLNMNYINGEWDQNGSHVYSLCKLAD